MKNTAIQRIVLGLLALFLMAYVGFQAYRFWNSRYKTEIAYSYTVTEDARVTGIALRNELLLDDRIGQGVAVYTAADGSKVSIDSPIAEVYQSEADASYTAKLRALANKRELLEKAQDPGTTSYAHADVLNKQIFSAVGDVVNLVELNSLTTLSDSADKLLVLMNTKQIATGKQESFQSAIDKLAAEEAYCAAKISGDPEIIRSPQPGYFIRGIDGYEELVDMKKLKNLDADMVFDLLNRQPKKAAAKNRRVGKLMIGHNWYFASTVPDGELEKYLLGAEVTLDFNLSGVDPVPAKISYINKDQEKGNVVIFRCGYINEALVNLRVAQADVRFHSVSGLRVSSSSIRFVGMQKGVYTVVGEKLMFRPVTVVHEDIGFVLCRENDPEYLNDPNFGRGLQQFDEVVIEGTNLYDEKQLG